MRLILRLYSADNFSPTDLTDFHRLFSHTQIFIFSHGSHGSHGFYPPCCSEANNKICVNLYARNQFNQSNPYSKIKSVLIRGIRGRLILRLYSTDKFSPTDLTDFHRLFFYHTNIYFLTRISRISRILSPPVVAKLTTKSVKSHVQ